MAGTFSSSSLLRRMSRNFFPLLSKRAFRFLLTYILGSSFALAQMGSTASHVELSTKLSVDKVARGSNFKAVVKVHIADGWHVNSHTPTHDYLIGTVFSLKPKEGYIITDIRYPRGNRLKFDFAEDSLDVYEGEIAIFVSFKASEKLAVGTDTLFGTVQLQACNNQICIAPSSIPVTIPFVVADASERVNAISQDEFTPSSETVSGYTQPRNELADLFESHGLLVAFLAIFVIGLALNLTPCVYPMLSVTVSLFGAQTETNLAKVFLKAVVYVLGIASMYSILGVTAALGGGLFGSWLQSPWVLGTIAALLFAMALSSFGAYQIQMPYWLTSKLGGTTGTGIIGLFVSGLVVGVFAAPCIGPPVIALLTLVGMKGDPVFGFWAFFILSLGLGFPYLILGTFSGLLKKIPRSGVWHVWVERIFGVVLAGAALFYLSLALVPKYAAYVVPLTLFVGGIYLGFIDNSGKHRPTLKKIQWAVGTVCILLGLYFANGMREPGISWESYSEKRLAEAKADGMPVIMDFYADWCIPCLELDRNTFTNVDVAKEAREFVRLKVDLTHFDSPEAEALRKKYNISGVPTIVFLNSNGDEHAESRVVGFLPPNDFLSKLKLVTAL
jgi:thiol:disulfide interchange protein DsbD